MTLNDVPKLKYTNSNNFFLLCGPCAIEGEDMALRIAEKVVKSQIRFKFHTCLRVALKKPTAAELIVSQELEMKKH